MRLGLLLLLVAACGGGEEFFDFVDGLDDAGESLQQPIDAVVNCTKSDLRLLRPIVGSAVEAALGDQPSPVAFTVAVHGGVMDIEVLGIDGNGLDVDVPVAVSFTWSITSAGVTGPQETGNLVLTLEPGGTVLITGDLTVSSACEISTFREMSLRIDPALLPTFRPTGTAEIYGAAANLLYVLEGDVTFDGAGKALVDATVTTTFGPSVERFAASLN